MSVAFNNIEIRDLYINLHKFEVMKIFLIVLKKERGPVP